MNMNDLHTIGDLVEKLSENTDTHFRLILDALTGVCWSEEERGELNNYFWDCE